MPEIFVGRFVKKHTAWIEKKLEHFKKNGEPLLARRSAKEYKAYKEPARALVHARVSYFNSFYDFPIGTIRIGNQRSRWGSCSAKQNLNFNYKIVFLPKELQDYIVVHELCHLSELNHSERFWELVAKQVPGWKQLRKELKKY